MQWEPGRAMVKVGRAPSSFIVAHRAVRGETRSSMVRVRGSAVICNMAASASVGRVGVARCVALVAVHVGMRSVQREACCTCMVEG